jgi:hypothetical protein
MALVHGSIRRLGHTPVWKRDGNHEPHEFTEWIFSDLPSFSELRRGDRERCSSFLSAEASKVGFEALTEDTQADLIAFLGTL